MKILDSYDEILQLLNTMENGFNMQLWQKYAEKISEELPQKLISDSSRYSFEDDILPVLCCVAQKQKELEKLHLAFLSTVKNLPEKVVEAFGIDLDVDIILYFGLCNGAGWATSLNGKKVVLIGAEKVLELGWYTEKHMQGLIYHELGHIWHKAVRTQKFDVETQKDKALYLLYTEGIAMYCEQLLCNDLSFYHQNSNGWLAWCIKNEKALFQEYLRRTDENESIEDFFGDWGEYKGHSDVGYFLGAKIIQKLSGEYSLNGLAKLSLDTFYKKLQSIN